MCIINIYFEVKSVSLLWKFTPRNLKFIIGNGEWCRKGLGSTGKFIYPEIGPFK